MRELAELALAEYRNGIAKQEQAALEAQLKLAQDELKRARPKIEQAKGRYAKIQAVSKGSAYDLSQEWRFEAGIVAAQERERIAGFMVEQAESKLKVLREYSIPVNSKNLMADVEKARSEELARKASWELEQSRLLTMQRTLGVAPRLTDHQKRMLAILDATIPIEEQLNKKLAECEKARDADESLRKEITALTGRLVAIVEEGRDAEADAALAKLSRNLRERSSSAAVDFGQASLPAVRSGEERPVGSKNTDAPLSVVLDSRKTLTKLKEELLRIAKQAREKAGATGRSQADVEDLAINQEITVKSAEANYENAKLTREVAEIGVVEYEEGIFPQDRATAEGELKLFESDLSRATDRIQLANDQLAKIRTASDGSIYDLALEFSFEDRVSESELQETKARIAVAKAQSKLDLLSKFTKARRIKEVQIAVEKDRATELAKQAQWEREKFKLAKLEEAVKRRGSAPRPSEGMRPLLERAIAIAEEIKSKLDLAVKEREPSAAAQGDHRPDGAASSAHRAGAGDDGRRSVGGAENESARGGTPLSAAPIENESDLAVDSPRKLDLGKEIAMPNSVVAITDHQRDHWLMRRSGLKRLRIAGASALTFVVVVIGLAHTLPTPARAGPELKPGPEPQRGNPKAPSTFFIESHEALKEMQEALSGLAVRALAGIAPEVGQTVDIASQRLVVEAKNAQLQAAKVALELLQLALKEYQEGIFKQEQAAREGALKLAQDELKRVKPKIEQAKERYAKIQAASTGSAYDLSQEQRFALGVEIAEGAEFNAQLMFEQAQWALKVLPGLQIASGTKELISGIEKARSEWKLEQSRLQKMQRAPSALPRLTDHQKRMLIILDAAIPIEELLSKKLAECEKAGDANESLRKEIKALAGRVAAVVEEGRDEEADAALATLSRNVRQSSTFGAGDFDQASLPAFGAGDEPPAASKNIVPASTSIVESRRSLRDFKDQILTVAKQAMETGDATSRSQADVRDAAINQEITVKSAAAEYENAKVKREVAEIGVVEYEEGMFIQDRATAVGELKLAESDLSRATDRIQLAKDQLAKIRTASDGSVYDLLVEFSSENHIRESELSEAKARIAVATAQSKLDLLNKFTKAKRIKELQIGVERARATELAKQARLVREKFKLAKLGATFKKQSSAPLPDEGVRSLLKRAISTVEELKSKLDVAAKDREPGEAAQGNHGPVGAAPIHCRAGAGDAGGGSMGGVKTEGARGGCLLSGAQIENWSEVAVQGGFAVSDLVSCFQPDNRSPWDGN